MARKGSYFPREVILLDRPSFQSHPGTDRNIGANRFHLHIKDNYIARRHSLIEWLQLEIKSRLFPREVA
jgi:hypothetical protein